MIPVQLFPAERPLTVEDSIAALETTIERFELAVAQDRMATELLLSLLVRAVETIHARLATAEARVAVLEGGA